MVKKILYDRGKPHINSTTTYNLSNKLETVGEVVKIRQLVLVDPNFSNAHLKGRLEKLLNEICSLCTQNKQESQLCSFDSGKTRKGILLLLLLIMAALHQFQSPNKM